MPKRRTDDAVHVVMTDHFIQRRRPAGNLLAPKTEFHDDLGGGYVGDVVLYYPPKSRDSDLYLAVAQVQEGANLPAGIPRLAGVVARRKPAAAEFYFELAEAYRKTGQNDKAVPMYEEALSRKPGLLAATRHLGVTLAATGRLDAAEQVLAKAPHDAPALNNLGDVYLRQGDTDRAVAAFRKAVALDPDLAEAHNNLGVALSRQGDAADAEVAFRDAVRIAPEVASARVNYGLLLLQLRRPDEAREQIETAGRIDPKLPSVETARRLLDRKEADASPRR
jgi:tetratricopeptide (TPR) repeat protein